MNYQFTLQQMLWSQTASDDLKLIELVVSLYSFTGVIQEVSHHSDVIHISLRGSIQQYGAMYASVVEEIKEDVLHKKTIRVPVEQLHFLIIRIRTKGIHVNPAQILQQTRKG